MEGNDVIKCIFGRRSIRCFKDEPLGREALQVIVECGAQAPSGRNLQDWRFTVIYTADKVAAWKESVSSAFDRTGTDRLHGFGNPAALVIVSCWKDDYNAAANGACAIMDMMLAAWSMGIGSVWINALRTIQDEDDIRGMLSGYGIPQNHMIVGTVALGLPAEPLPKKPERKANVVRFIE